MTTRLIAWNTILASNALFCGIGGAVNVEKVMEFVKSDLENFALESALQSEEIQKAVVGVFEENAGKKLLTDTVVHYAVIKLGATSETMGMLQKRVKEFLSANTQGKKNKDTGKYENPDSLIVATKGRGTAGLCLRSDKAALGTEEE